MWINGLLRRVMEILNAIHFGAPKRTSRGLYLQLSRDQFSGIVDIYMSVKTYRAWVSRYGSVGCGKTMSMDIFFSALKSHPTLRVQRPVQVFNGHCATNRLPVRPSQLLRCPLGHDHAYNCGQKPCRYFSRICSDLGWVAKSALDICII